MGDDYASINSSVLDSEPLATCVGGEHGTHTVGKCEPDSFRPHARFGLELSNIIQELLQLKISKQLLLLTVTLGTLVAPL